MTRAVSKFTLSERAATKGRTGLPYPPADTEVVSFLLKNDAAYYEDVLLRYLIFFEHLFSRVEEVMKELTKDQYTDECDLARVWWDYLTTNRASLYESVIKRITVRSSFRHSLL